MLLAFLVVFGHLGGIPAIGRYAVFGFYILSGYLMTYIMHNTYGYSIKGVLQYSMNRFLRIYPVYWISCIISLLVIYYVGENYTKLFYPDIYFPNSYFASIRNALIFFPIYHATPKLIPPAWTLTVELFFYVAIGLGVSKNRIITLSWFSFSLIYTIIINILGLSLTFKYFFFPAASLPFATGAMIYHWRAYLSPLVTYIGANMRLYLLIGIVVCDIVNYKLAYSHNAFDSYHYYINYVSQTLIIFILSSIDKPIPSLKMIDKIFGDFSYPIYLIHFQAGIITVVLSSYLGINLVMPKISLALLSIPLILGVSWFLIIFIERPMNVLRDKHKRPASTKPYSIHAIKYNASIST
jgi:peptidoglycan/LPS O-acetylase OafA/YrhL